MSLLVQFVRPEEIEEEEEEGIVVYIRCMQRENKNSHSKGLQNSARALLKYGKDIFPGFP